MGQDLLEQIGGGPKVNIVGLEHRVRIPIANHGNVDVVGAAAAGQHGVELLSGLLTGNDAVHGVGGDTLRGVHGAGVTELDGGLDVVGGQGDHAAVRRAALLNPPVLVRLRMIHRSPFFTQSVALIRSLRSLLRVMIRSPTLAWLRSASSTCRPGTLPARR